MLRLPYSLAFGISIALFFSSSSVHAYELYYANLHSHTSYSDGASLPVHAFAYARDTAGISVLAVTDHGELLSNSEWQDVILQAHQATIPGRFIGLAGFEWSSPFQGHTNVFFTDDYTSFLLTPTIGQFYTWLSRRPQAVGQFNHPTPDNYRSFAYNNAADSQMYLYEIQNTEQALNYHIPLDSGWRVGAVANQDNHSADWGAGHQLTGIWTESLTVSAITRALKQMRTFATLDRNSRMQFFANDSWMGSIIPNGEIRFRVVVKDSDRAERFRRLEIVTNRNIVLDSLLYPDSNYVEWTPRPITTGPDERRWFFCRAIQTDGNIVQSSAIWTEPTTKMATESVVPTLPVLIVTPNPASGPIKVSFSGAVFCPRSISIFDPVGRLINIIPVDLRTNTAMWTGTDGNGLPLPRGVYLLVPETVFSSVKLVLIR